MTSDEAGEKPAGKTGLKTVLFFLVVGGVIAGFAYLSSLGGAPPMKPLPQHRFRFNTKGELVGLMSDKEAALGPQLPVAGVKFELKETEKRINQTCLACHGAFPGWTGPGADQTPFDPRSHACAQGPMPCLPEHHPPKLECIKCHRVKE